MDIKVFDLGLTEYTAAYQLQRNIFEQVRSAQLDSSVILCSHPPVITSGRRINELNFLTPKIKVQEKGIPVIQTERGGDLTYHGPGQLTVYPIINLSRMKKDIHLFLRILEQAIITFMSDLGISAERRQGMTGVWVGEKKIASIGIAIRHWVSFHGLSINIKEDDLANFALIKPCGMDVEMTALETVLGKKIEVKEIKNNFITNLNQAFGRRVYG